MNGSSNILFHAVRRTLAMAAMALTYPLQVQAQDDGTETLRAFLCDSAVARQTEISLVTCEPTHRIYALYGHTGLRIHHAESGLDLLANWGIFDMRQSGFAVRFTFGLTDYKMEIEQWPDFCHRYICLGSGVCEQVLSLTVGEKLALVEAVMENYRPENRYYRYNFYYDNCTTRVRDIIEQCLDGELLYPERSPKETFRQLIHDWNGSHLWMRWGKDYILGAGSDRLATDREAQFLPFNLLEDFDKAVITRGGTVPRKIVEETRWAVPPIYNKGENSLADEYLLSPTAAAMAFALLFVVVWMWEYKRKCRLWAFDIMVMLVTGTMGLVPLAMIFSQHPTVRLNFQILIFNPLALVLALPALKKLRRGKAPGELRVLAGLTAAGLILGMAVQHYAEGVMTLALFLFLTYMRPNRKKI